MEEYTSELTMIEKRAKTSQPIDDLLARRWSCRAFDINRPVTKEQIISLSEAARWAPSCNGDEPWRMIIWNRDENREAYDRAFAILDKWNQKWVKNCPVLIAVFADSFFRNGKPNRWGQYDTGAAAVSLVLQAVSLGLMAHEMGGFNKEELKKEFNIPDQFTPMAMIAVGYQAEPEVLEYDKHRESETAPRKRQPLGSGFFDSEWESPIDG